ncbi:hypothetical protein FQZ97_681320 [compost metagenome]
MSGNVFMKFASLASILGVFLVLSACATPSVPSQSYDEVYRSYLQGHLEMLKTQAPWMTEAQRQAHAQAQADEVIKSLKAQEQLGGVVPPVLVPLPQPPAGDTSMAVEAPQPEQSVAEISVPVPAMQPSTAHAQAASPTLARVSPQSEVPVAASEVAENDESLAGTYVIEGGSYSMTVEQEGNALVVVDSSKRSRYERQGDGSYQYYNPDTGSTFSLRFVDRGRVEADRVPSEGTPTILARVDAPTAANAATDNQAHAAIAQRYSEMAQSDPDNAQAWSMCAAVAFKRSQSDGEDFSRYARQMAETLKLMDANGNPCSDAIPDIYW